MFQQCIAAPVHAEVTTRLKHRLLMSSSCTTTITLPSVRHPMLAHGSFRLTSLSNNQTTPSITFGENSAAKRIRAWRQPCPSFKRPGATRFQHTLRLLWTFTHTNKTASLPIEAGYLSHNHYSSSLPPSNSRYRVPCALRRISANRFNM